MASDSKGVVLGESPARVTEEGLTENVIKGETITKTKKGDRLALCRFHWNQGGGCSRHQRRTHHPSHSTEFSDCSSAGHGPKVKRMVFWGQQYG